MLRKVTLTNYILIKGGNSNFGYEVITPCTANKVKLHNYYSVMLI